MSKKVFAVGLGRDVHGTVPHIGQIGNYFLRRKAQVFFLKHSNSHDTHALTANVAILAQASRLKRPMDRRVAAAAGSSSLSTVVLHLLAQSLSGSPPQLEQCPVELPPIEEFDNRSFLLGLLLGLAAGPVIEVLHGLKLLWRRTATRWWATLCKHPLALYKVNEQ